MTRRRISRAFVTFFRRARDVSYASMARRIVGVSAVNLRNEICRKNQTDMVTVSYSLRYDDNASGKTHSTGAYLLPAVSTSCRRYKEKRTVDLD